ncbi:unnamed protein product [Lymnaea stagnalis]|uniref:Uncharacterized protein n=1 Tax=Lymnaea stagnalis TaxID=6523 RepID=A0AAV2HID6_LYMST
MRQKWKNLKFTADFLLKIGILFEHLKDNYANHCDPAQEGSQYNFKLNVNLSEHIDPTDLLILNEGTGTPIAKCDVVKSLCKPNFSRLIAVGISKEKSSYISTLNVTIFKITRDKKYLNAEGKWTVRSNNEIVSSCFVHVFSRPPNVRCISDACNKVLQLTCLTSQVYPSITCEFSFKNTSNVSKQKILYSHIKLPGKVTYFLSMCFSKFPITHKFQGVGNVIIHPDIEGHGKANTFFMNETLPIDTGLENCEKRMPVPYHLKFHCSFHSYFDESEVVVEAANLTVISCNISSNKCKNLSKKMLNITYNHLTAHKVWLEIDIYDISKDDILNTIGNWTIVYDSFVVCSKKLNGYGRTSSQIAPEQLEKLYLRLSDSAPTQGKSKGCSQDYTLLKTLTIISRHCEADDVFMSYFPVL